ncbi:hypothetical protein BDD12DRAFT_880081 [Trichophaea hybrida]|nr:hypothetical protein BDD12DRAFT_880081 [Trichophaea hybrida]
MPPPSSEIGKYKHSPSTPMQLLMGYDMNSEPVSAVEVHNRRNVIFHRSFRMRYEVTQEPGAKGGSVAGSFFYYNDEVESNTEIIMKDGNDSLTAVHYANQPAFDLDKDLFVSGAFYKESLDQSWAEHRFNWTNASVKVGIHYVDLYFNTTDSNDGKDDEFNKATAKKGDDSDIMEEAESSGDMAIVVNVSFLGAVYEVVYPGHYKGPT